MIHKMNSGNIKRERLVVNLGGAGSVEKCLYCPIVLLSITLVFVDSQVDSQWRGPLKLFLRPEQTISPTHHDRHQLSEYFFEIRLPY